jgi:HAD superfamily hydrolase (TIGR01509 family)
MKRFSCVIFDIDGTLTQTNELIYATFNHVAEKYIRKTFTPKEIVGMFGPPEEIAIERLIGSEHCLEAMKDFYAYYEAHHPRLAETYEGIREVLEKLKSRGILLAVFTGKGKETTRITLEKFGLKQYFDLVVTGSDVVHHKPSAEGIQNVMKAFSLLPEEVLMVGDAVSDVKAAREAGVSMASVLWDSYAKEKVMAMEVEHSFHSVKELASWLEVMIPANGVAKA